MQRRRAPMRLLGTMTTTTTASFALVWLLLVVLLAHPGGSRADRTVAPLSASPSISRMSLFWGSDARPSRPKSSRSKATLTSAISKSLERLREQKSRHPTAGTTAPAAPDDRTARPALAQYWNRHDRHCQQTTVSAYLSRRKTVESPLTALTEARGDAGGGLGRDSLATLCARTKGTQGTRTAFGLGSGTKQVPATRATTPPSTTASRSAVVPHQKHALNFWENMVCGAVSRSVAQTIMHPANTMKTMLQSSSRAQSMAELLQPRNFQRLTRGAGANLILSVPSGAVNFAVLELVRKQLATWIESDADSSDRGRKRNDQSSSLSRRAALLGPSLDFMSSAISTITCSVVATPQMVITDNIMAGNYPNLPQAIRGISASGLSGFYRGWWPGMVGKIPSYAITWTLFQQFKNVRSHWTGRPAKDWENTVMGCVASGTSVSIMIPLDTIKTRLVTQMVNSPNAYKGIVDCAVRVAREEGIGAFYRGLPPRLVSVVPMIGIQFGVYEFMRRSLQERKVSEALRQRQETHGSEAVFEEAFMEVAASGEDPSPVPHFLEGKLRRNIKKQPGKTKQAPRTREKR